MKEERRKDLLAISDRHIIRICPRGSSWLAGASLWTIDKLDPFAFACPRRHKHFFAMIDGICGHEYYVR